MAWNWALFGFVCASIGALIGCLMMALAVAARDEPRAWADREPLVDEADDEPDELDELDDVED